jgi:hypothetical protein
MLWLSDFTYVSTWGGFAILLPHEGVERVIQQLAEHHACRAHRQSP